MRAMAMASWAAGEPLRLIELPAPDVEVAQEVAGVPVARLILDEAHVLSDRLIQFSLAQQLFRLTQRGGTIDGHGQAIVSNTVDALNERRCTSE